jgi:cell division protein FtsB
MEALGILGFIFGIAALAQVLQLKKTVESSKKEVDNLKK